MRPCFLIFPRLAVPKFNDAITCGTTIIVINRIKMVSKTQYKARTRRLLNQIEDLQEDQ